jgi:hypothetical protein
MRPIFFNIAIMILSIFISCEEQPIWSQLSLQYDKLLFVRRGANAKIFSVNPTATIDTFIINVSSLNFQDTVITIIVPIDSANAVAFNALDQALNGKYKIYGNFRQQAVPAGTWALLYMVKNSTQTEITNNDLRNSLMYFEIKVDSRL